MQEGIGGPGLAHWRARLTWRPDARTGAVLIAAYALYSVILGSRTLGNALSEIGGQCAPAAGVSRSLCTVPDYVRAVAIIGLIYQLMELALIAGAVALVLGRRAGRAVMVVAALLMGLAEILEARIEESANPFNGIGAFWPFFFNAGAMILLAGFVAVLRVPASPTPPRDAPTPP